MNNGSPKTIILPVGGLPLSAIGVLLGVGSLVSAFLTISDNPCYADYMVAYAAIGLALVLLVPGIVGLGLCIRRTRRQQ